MTETAINSMLYETNPSAACSQGQQPGSTSFAGRGEGQPLCRAPYQPHLMLYQIHRQQRLQFPFFPFSITARQSERRARSKESPVLGAASCTHRPSFTPPVGQREGKSSGLMAGEQREVHAHQAEHTQLDPSLCQNSKREIWPSQCQ